MWVQLQDETGQKFLDSLIVLVTVNSISQSVMNIMAIHNVIHI
jgi:hypothetical protein